ADPALFRVDLVRADDAVEQGFTRVDVLEFDGGAEEHLGAVAGLAFGHLQRGNPLAEVTYAAIDLGELLLPIDVFGVLRAVAFGRRRGDRLDHLRAHGVPQMVQLGLESLETFAGDDRARAGGGRTPAAHARPARRCRCCPISACWSACPASRREASSP